MSNDEHHDFKCFHLDKDAVGCLFNLFYLSDKLTIGSILIIHKYKARWSYPWVRGEAA